jgi:ethanolamine ammonia-lyase small subunit
MSDTDPISSCGVTTKHDTEAGSGSPKASPFPEHGSITPEIHPLSQLRRFTPARIALGRTGCSLPTLELLQFGAAHAMARDAVQIAFDSSVIRKELLAHQLSFIQVKSAADDRATYLRRPDLGRRLDEESRNRLSSLELPIKPQIVFIIADGLSPRAPQRYAVDVIQAARKLLEGFQIGPVVIAEQARVAIGDDVGEILKADIVITLIGERPGLSSPESLGIYLTYAPRTGRSDADRNCISNVRSEGTIPEQAAQTLRHLITNSFRLKVSGVALKDDRTLSRTADDDPVGTEADQDNSSLRDLETTGY